MSKFEVGEIAILFAPGEPGHLCDVEVVSILLPAGHIPVGGNSSAANMLPSHRIFAEGHYGFAPPSMLRKKKPPQALSTWEDIQKETGWHPQKVTA